MSINKIYNPKPIAIYILGKFAIGDVKHPFKATASIFGAGAFFIHAIFSPLLSHLLDKKQKPLLYDETGNTK